MLDIILFAFITACSITFVLFLDASSNDPNVFFADYIKHFCIVFLINLFGMFVFSSMNKNSIFDAPVNVGLLD